MDSTTDKKEVIWQGLFLDGVLVLTAGRTAKLSSITYQFQSNDFQIQGVSTFHDAEDKEHISLTPSELDVTRYLDSLAAHIMANMIEHREKEKISLQ